MHLPYRWRASRSPSCPEGPCPEGPFFTWTVARDPWKRALSGYAEVMKRAKASISRCDVDPRECLGFNGVGWNSHDVDPRMNVSARASSANASMSTFAHLLSMTCDTTASATRRYAEFLAACAAGHVSYRELFHVWPGALLMDVLDAPPRFDAIAHLENMESELAALLRLAGHTNLSLAPLKDHHHSHAADPCVSDVDPTDPRVMVTFCQLYRADYACFDYDVPPACRAFAKYIDP
mmetsp:Transcript_6292/g.19871  ORF Transcript_6292/g.19871 Transcript_6292/m.19871 type:complete len:236 (+) Transcript_6292:418-1125(+)